jgi:hypothetical protein
MNIADDNAARQCTLCGTPMAFVARLSPIGSKGGLVVFRCHVCNRVESEPVT